MIDEVTIKFAQGLSRCFLIRRANLARDLAAPKQIVDYHDAARAQPRQSESEIVGIFFLDRVEKDQIKSLIELRKNVQRFAAFNAHSFAHAGA